MTLITFTTHASLRCHYFRVKTHQWCRREREKLSMSLGLLPMHLFSTSERMRENLNKMIVCHQIPSEYSRTHTG